MPEFSPLDSLIYLASQSPRRQALLSQIGVPFEVLTLDEAAIAEVPLPGEAPTAYVQRMAHAKAIAGMQLCQKQLPEPLPVLAVLGADTEVVLENRIFGKPQDRQNAAAMLCALSGKTHEVISAVALCLPARKGRATELVDRVVVSRVTFKTLRNEEIERYLDSDEPFGKAGAYAIQGHAGAFVTHLEGSYSGVVGLPLFETMQLFELLHLKFFA
ncbi:MAG: Maf family nucleotide pyrophosphatase [Burkholderiales bacterium]|jgi:septum formation protein|nr:Maf family nucleotide pyrophosphatase [Burkholderiales bacterium]